MLEKWALRSIWSEAIYVVKQSRNLIPNRHTCEYIKSRQNRIIGAEQ